MNWKFWQTREAVPFSITDLFDPAWPAKKALLLDRLANTPPGDPLMTGLLATLDQSLLGQLHRCEDPRVTDSEARAIVNSLGLLLGLRADLDRQWRMQLTRKANAEAAAKAAATAAQKAA